MFTLVINERLIEFLGARNILSHYQSGFGRGHGTADHVFILNTILNSYFSKVEKFYTCFINFSKAYDSVWRNGLLYKLILNGLSLKFIFLIKSTYTELQATLTLPNRVTPYFSLLVGVRQGCNLSPMLFNLFVNDIFYLFDNAKCDPVKLHTKLIHCLMYADNLLILFFYFVYFLFQQNHKLLQILRSRTLGLYEYVWIGSPPANPPSPTMQHNAHR